ARDRLSQVMFAHVTSLLAHQPRIGRVVALTTERPPGWTGPLIADRGRGLNAELAAARAALGVAPLLILHSDLPLLQHQDIAALLTAAPAVAPDRHGTGTNALALPPNQTLQFRFGPNSFRRHCTELPEARIVRRPGLGLDLDTEEDLSRAIAAGFDEERGFWMKDQRSRFLTGA
ncbi:MAG TPA: hypothetical protein VMB71_14395, partial [Acetobacteraceae bacterium]|nr:hypothetical protein [Acetobacteraceae bacterium]